MFLDQVTIVSILQLLPHALDHRIRRWAPLRFRYFSATSSGRRMLSVLERVGLMAGEEADYSYIDVLDFDGSLTILRALEMDPVAICTAARSSHFESNPNIGRFAKWFDRERLYLYLQKALEEEISNTLVQINVVAWFHRRENLLEAENASFLLPRSLWFRQLQSYAAAHGVELRGYRPLYKAPNFPWLKVIGLAWSLGLRSLKPFTARKTAAATAPKNNPARGDRGVAPALTVAAPSWGRGLTLDLSKNGDLFWVPFANLDPDQLLVYATRRDDPLDDSRYADLRRSSIRAMAITSVAKGGPTVPTWPHQVHYKHLVTEVLRVWKLLGTSLVRATLTRGVNGWINRGILKFGLSYVYWRWFFTCHNVRVHVDHIDWAKARLASDQALADLGGVSVGFQRTFEPYTTIVRASAVDVHFAFSMAWADSERNSRSFIPQYISNGYLHDHAFARVGERSAQLRNRLAGRGARFVICFLDENSVADKRKGPSHPMRAENYRFLLEKLLADPTLGLIIKPKKPIDLRQRLDPVVELLDAALATGRCHLFTEGIVATSTLPCEASLAADITIGLLFGSTAALESALAGTPTLLVDREFVTYHTCYALGQGKVVFRKWDALWEALTDYRKDPASMPKLGNWSPLLSTLDSFQDGQAARRMGEYIGWLADSLAQGMTRDEAMESARRQYVALWGSDKIVDLRAGVPQPAEALQLHG